MPQQPQEIIIKRNNITPNNIWIGSNSESKAIHITSVLHPDNLCFIFPRRNDTIWWETMDFLLDRGSSITRILIGLCVFPGLRSTQLVSGRKSVARIHCNKCVHRYWIQSYRKQSVKGTFFLHNDVVKLSSDKKSAMQLCELWMLFFRFIRLKPKYIQIKWKLRLLSGLVEGVGPAKQVCLTTCIAYSFTCSLDACMGL